MVLKKINRSKISFGIAAGIIFLIMLICNLYTDLIVDDFTYLYSFADGTRIDSVLDIFPSMVSHYSSMNGRLIPHFFAQLFLYLPLGIFKVLNPLMFMLQLYLIYKLCNRQNERNTLLFVSIFCLIWIFQPAFGQVNLWLDGACNYLWCIVFQLIYLMPFIDKFILNRNVHSRALQILMILSGFVAGAYSENAAPASIFMVFVLMMITLFYKHNKLEYYHYAAFAASLLGFVCLMAAPSEWDNKAAAFSMQVLYNNFMFTLEMYGRFWILLAAFVVLLILAIASKRPPEITIVSGILFAGSLCSNFIMTVASYYDDRSAFYSVILLIAACGILAAELFNTRFVPVAAIAGLCAVAFTFYYGYIGIQDIYVTHTRIEANENYIIECRDNGETDLRVPFISTETKYSALYDLIYLNTSTTNTWPNVSMAKYYGVNSIIGYYP